jgi:hypothetical protein
MSPRVLLVAFTMNAVVSRLLRRRATNGLGGAPASLSALPRFIGNAAHVAQHLQGERSIDVVVVSREKLGVATASVGAGFYALVALSAWLVYGQALSPLRWIGIVLVTGGVVCISQGQL